MIYSTYYESSITNSKYMAEVDELTYRCFDWSSAKESDEQTQLKIKILNFAKIYKDKAIVIEFDYLDESDIPFLKKIYNQNSNCTISIPFDYNYKYLCPMLKDNNIRFMFRDIANCWCDFRLFLKEKPSQILIGNELCFNLPTVHKIAAENDCLIRVIPNFVPRNTAISSFQEFFLAPEDLEILKDTIDVVEIIRYSEDPQGHLINTSLPLIHIYKTDKQWMGNLNEIITNLDESIPNQGIIRPKFIKRRSICKQKCLYDKCNFCNIVKDLAYIAKKQGVLIVPQEEETIS